MKHTLITLIVAFVFLSCSGGKEKMVSSENISDEQQALRELTEPANETLDELGASLILLLKENDFEKFTSFLPAKEDAEKIALQYKGAAEKKKQLLLKLEENVKKIMIYSKTGFDEVFNKALKENITWSEVNFSHVEYQINKNDNLERASMTVYFLFNNLNYRINIDECVKSDRGWLITDKPTWKNLD